MMLFLLLYHTSNPHFRVINQIIITEKILFSSHFIFFFDLIDYSRLYPISDTDYATKETVLFCYFISMKYKIYEDERNQNCADKRVNEYSDIMSAKMKFCSSYFTHSVLRST